MLTGPVIYLYSDTGGDSTSYYFAVDTGAAEAVKYPTGPVMYGRPTIGTVLRLEVTPKLGYVRRCDIVATPTPQPVDDRSLPSTLRGSVVRLIRTPRRHGQACTYVT